MKVLCVASAGGHLAQLAELRRHWGDTDVHWVTAHQTDAIERVQGDPTTWGYFPTTRNVVNAIRNFGLALRLLRKLRPQVVISTGAGIAVPFFVAARIYRIPTVYLEVYDRVTLPTLAGRLCYPIADTFLIQWPQQRASYPAATVVGRVY